MIRKLVSRTEWQAFLVSVAVMFANRFLELGLSEGDVYAMFGGSGTYAIGRGLAKGGEATAAPAVPSGVAETGEAVGDG
jgi:hypothetical protein